MMRQNKWHEIWEKRKANLEKIDMNDYQAVFAELKRINGFDINGEGIPLSALVKQYEDTRRMLKVSRGESLFEVGCGCGANLYMFQRDGIIVGGMDYSQKLIEILQSVISGNTLRECICGEAVDMPTEIKYDAILSNSVFSYFPDFAYAEEVLEKIFIKARHSIALLDVHDAEKKDEFIAYRIKSTENYEERYKDLPKLFYPQKLFQNFAAKHNLRIEFCSSKVEGYWNNDFIYNVYMYK